MAGIGFADGLILQNQKSYMLTSLKPP